MRLILHTLAFVAIAPGAVAVAVPAAVLWLSGGDAAGGAWLLAGAVVLAAGLALFAWCVADFVARGRGTPDPGMPPERLVVRGPFRFARNPMYLGLLTMIAGEALLFASPWLVAWGIALFAAFHARIVVYEEPTLARTFGAEWHAYRRAVPRWLPHPPGRGGG